MIECEPQALLVNAKTIPLTKELFAKDALVLKGLKSAGINLRSAQTERGLKMTFLGFPFLGIWAAPGADFVCIEPWCGIADSVDSDQQWITIRKVSICLEAGGAFERTWTLSLF